MCANPLPPPCSALKSGPQSSSAMCAALLEAAGILPDAQGRRIGVQGKQAAGEGVAGQDGGAGAVGGEAGIAGAAAAVRYLHSRRQLYDAMETALLERGLALGGCWRQQDHYHVAQGSNGCGRADGCCCMLAQRCCIITTPPCSPSPCTWRRCEQHAGHGSWGHVPPRRRRAAAASAARAPSPCQGGGAAHSRCTGCAVRRC